MISVQDQCDVKPTRRLRVGRLAVQHVEEVRGMAQLGDRSEGLLPLPDSSESRHQRAHLGGQAERLAAVRRLRHVVRLGIVERQGGHRRAQDLHRVLRRRKAFQQVQDFWRNLPVRGQVALEFF